MNGNLLFVGGDLSGIQDFIYNITSKKAMVSLKGRSQYLKDFTDEVCNEILNIPEIQSENKEEMKIYSSGGKFYLQVLDTPEVRKQILKIRRETEEKLWNEHKGQLSINIGFVPFKYNNELVTVDSETGNETGNIGILWDHITKKFNALKNQKFQSLLLDKYEEFFEVQEVGGEVKVCAVTGIEGAKEYTFNFKEDDQIKEESLTVLPSVKKHIDKGIQLRYEQNFKMLEDYAKDSYLGILRMDVDGLGKRFIKSSFNSISEYKKFSKKLDNFFTTKLLEIQNDADFKEHMNIVYAGGDDIFAVGKWNKVIEFAEKVQIEFKKYISDSTLSISGGIAIVGAKFPIAKAAELAGEAEDKAKKYKNGQKNAFCMFGEAVSWKDEFEYVKRFKNSFVTLINDYNLSRGILHKIMNYAAIVKKNEIIKEENQNGNNKRKPDYSYLWHTAYYLTRYMGKEKENKTVYDFCKDLRDKQLHNVENFRLIGLAARWAELEIRKYE